MIAKTRCAAEKGDGTKCERIVGASQHYCYSHDPARAGERQRNAIKAGKAGGRGRANADLRDRYALLDRILASVKSGAMDKGVAAVACQLIGLQVRILRIERDFDLSDLVERVDMLEEAANARERGAW